MNRYKPITHCVRCTYGAVTAGFWGVTPCSLVEVYLLDITSYNTAVFVLNDLVFIKVWITPWGTIGPLSSGYRAFFFSAGKGAGRDYLALNVHCEFFFKHWYLIKYRKCYTKLLRLFFASYLKKIILALFFSLTLQPKSRLGRLVLRFLHSIQLNTHLVAFLRTSDQPVAEAAIYATHNEHKRRLFRN